MSKVVYQSSSLYVKEKGRYRHVTTPEIFEKMGLSWEGKYRQYVNDGEIEDNLGKPITDYPEPEYVVGSERLVWCVPLDCDFQDIVDAGFTAIHTYGPYWGPNHGRDFLDKAEAHGLKVLFCMKAQVHDMLIAGHPWDRSECQRIVNLFDSHPALWSYIYFDEADAADDSPKHFVSMELQKEIHDAFRSWTNKPLTTVVRGGTRGWHLVDLKLFDFIMADSYVIDGEPWVWEPGLTWQGALHMVGKQERTYLDKHLPDMPIMFVFQSSDSVAKAAGNDNTRIPEGKIEEQFNILIEYKLFSHGVGMYPWSGGDFAPINAPELRQEIRGLFDKLK